MLSISITDLPLFPLEFVTLIIRIHLINPKMQLFDVKRNKKF